MNGRLCQAVAVVLALAVLVSLAADLMLKSRADLSQVFWSCYWGAMATALGIFFRRDWVVSSGLVFFLGLGLPAWILGHFMDERIDPTSVLIHVAPVAAGCVYLINKARLPRFSAAGAWTLHLMPLILAHFFTSPEKNINLAHSAWGPASNLLPRIWEFHAAILAASAITLTFVARVIDYVLAQRIMPATETYKSAWHVH